MATAHRHACVVLEAIKSLILESLVWKWNHTCPTLRSVKQSMVLQAWAHCSASAAEEVAT